MCLDSFQVKTQRRHHQHQPQKFQLKAGLQTVSSNTIIPNEGKKLVCREGEEDVGKRKVQKEND